MKTYNPHLKAIMPVASSFDVYGAVCYPGGVYNESFNSFFTASTASLEKMIVPVDGDLSGHQLLEILEKRKYISEGILRASHRSLNQLPYKYFGLPYHRSYESDILPIPEKQPVNLKLDLFPTSYLFHEGCSIRLRIACADADNFRTPKITPEPVVRILRNKRGFK